MTEHAQEISNCGFEINLGHLRSKSPSQMSTSGLRSSESDAYYSLPLSSVRSLDENDPSKRWTHGTMYLTSAYEPAPDANSEENGVFDDKSSKRQIVYPYWAWKPCHLCRTTSRLYGAGLAIESLRPPRTHHCHVCNCCVLKRDHHCFFTGRCVGVRNQRHFVVFTFWSTVSITYSLIHSVLYAYTEFIPRTSAWDLFLPMTGVRCWLGYASRLDTLMVFIFYSLLWFFVTTVGLLVEQWKVIRKGVTSFEEDNEMKVINRRVLSENVRGVFGRHWWANFIVPLHWVFVNEEDGIEWEGISV